MNTATTQLRHTVVESALGDLTVLARDEAIVGVYFPHHWYRPDDASLGPRVTPSDDDVLEEAARQLRDYLRGDRVAFDLPTATDGDDFQERVWAIVRDVPRGATTTYGAIAELLGDRTQAQAVGQAVGRNPICVIVPCHRVVGAGGRSTGYAGGLQRKRYLLELEEPVGTRTERLF